MKECNKSARIEEGIARVILFKGAHIDDMSYNTYYREAGSMARFDVVYFEDECGVCPVKEFIDSQPVKMRAKIAMELELLQDLGNVLREPYSKYIEDGIFELRCKVASDITRLLYFFHEGRIVVLTNGFAKKGRKTPRKEIDLAKERRISYLKRRQKR